MFFECFDMSIIWKILKSVSFRGAKNSPSMAATRWFNLFRVIVATTYLPVGIHNRAEQFPGAAAPIHPNHTQNLKETKASQRRRGQHLSGRSNQKHDGGGANHNQIDDTKGRPDETEPAEPTLVARPTSGRPSANEEFNCKPIDHHNFLFMLRNFFS